VADDPRPPVAIRITRPYASEEEYLEQEVDTLTRASITLIGAQPRPQGVVLRFELVLSSGLVLMRGEGRVVGFKPNVHQGLGGLSLRFTRLDTRSKALIDKAAALRERRRPSAVPGVAEAEPGASSPSLPALSPSLAPSLPAPSPRLAPRFVPPLPSLAPFAPAPSYAPEGHAAEPPLDLESTRAEAPRAKRSDRVGPTPSAAPAPERDALLARLRDRMKALDPAVVDGILEQRRRARAQ
jgi:hypothetical protein